MRIDPLHRWKTALYRLDHALKLALFLPWGGAGRVARRFVGQLEVRRLALAFPDLPRAWDGVTITHLTDLHLGPAFTPEHHLPPVLDVCRELASDLICVTGDWIDTENRWLPPALAQMRSLKPPLGWFGVLGNHDSIDNRRRLSGMLREWLGAGLLANRTVRLVRDGEALDISGLSYAMRPGQSARHLAAWQKQRSSPPGFGIALAHHPGEFDALRAAGVRLVLAGHTHGGQISLTAAPAPSLGPASWQFRYLRGLYERGDGPDASKLLVSCGLGHSFPVRLNCPPEIWQIRLVRG